MYTGNIGIANDIETILKSASDMKVEFPNIVFIFIGGGLNVSKYRNQAQNEKLTNIQFIESQPKKDMPNILNAADLCLATLKNISLFSTNYPNKVFDYMAAGKPTILAIDGEMRKVVEEAEGGLYVEPENSQELKNVILKYYYDQNLIYQHGENAKKYVTENFDRKEITAKFNHYLESLLSNENF